MCIMFATMVDHASRARAVTRTKIYEDLADSLSYGFEEVRRWTRKGHCVNKAIFQSPYMLITTMLYFAESKPRVEPGTLIQFVKEGVEDHEIENFDYSELFLAFLKQFLLKPYVDYTWVGRFVGLWRNDETIPSNTSNGELSPLVRIIDVIEQSSTCKITSIIRHFHPNESEFANVLNYLTQVGQTFGRNDVDSIIDGTQISQQHLKNSVYLLVLDPHFVRLQKLFGLLSFSLEDRTEFVTRYLNQPIFDPQRLGMLINALRFNERQCLDLLNQIIPTLYDKLPQQEAIDCLVTSGVEKDKAHMIWEQEFNRRNREALNTKRERFLFRILIGLSVTFAGAFFLLVVSSSLIRDQNLPLIDEVVWGVVLVGNALAGVIIGDLCWRRFRANTVDTSRITMLPSYIRCLGIGLTGGILGGVVWYLCSLYLPEVGVDSTRRLLVTILWANFYILAVIATCYALKQTRSLKINDIANIQANIQYIAVYSMIILCVGALIWFLSTRFNTIEEIANLTVINDYMMASLVRGTAVIYISLQLSFSSNSATS